MNGRAVTLWCGALDEGAAGTRKLVLKVPQKHGRCPGDGPASPGSVQ